MPKYKYLAFDESGAEKNGSLDADSLEMALNQLNARGWIPSRVMAASGASAGFTIQAVNEYLTPVNAPELILFTKQFRTMLRSGVPMIKLLQILETQTENIRLKSIILAMAEDIREGASLHDAFRKHPKAFSPLYCSMVQAGEASGALPEVLDRLSYIIEHEHKIKSDIRSALQYPLIVILFLFLAFFTLLTFVLPKFVRIFLSAGLTLPWPTRICLSLYEIINRHWPILLLGVAAGLLLLIYYLRTEPGRYARDTILLRTPLIGSLFLKAAMSRFASIFAILQSSGVEIRECMKILTGTMGNSAIAREFEKITSRLEEGRGISGPLKEAAYFTPIVVNMIGIGEESGKLDEMLSEISAHYDFELEYAMKKMSDGIGPVLTIGLAAVVGFFALAIFLPMWDMTKMVH
ncbi:MAG: type II secretion system F family protein [Thermodesulfobacteriota bacterium]